VFAWHRREACRRSLYNRTAALRLCQRLWRLSACRRPHGIGPAAIIAAVCVVALSGCSYKLGSLVSADDGDPQTTGAIAPAAAAPATDTPKPSPRAELDLACARAAVSNVLSRGGKDTSVPWHNPQTGAGGNVMPLANSFTEAGMPCRDFLASYVHGGSQDWLQGAACRTASGTWEVKRLKSLKSR